MADESPDDISLTSIVLGTAVRYELRLGPVIVKVSPDTAVVMFCVPAILNDSPSETRVPDESSPTNVMPCADAEPVIVMVSPDTAVVTEPAPALLKVSPILNVVPVESSPTTVILAAVFCVVLSEKTMLAPVCILMLSKNKL